MSPGMRAAVLIFFALSTMAFAKDNKLVSLSSSKTVSPSEVQAGPSLVVFWASWCKGCSENMAALIESSDKDTLSQKMRGISVDETPGAAQSYFEAKPHLLPFHPVSYLDAGGEWAANIKLDGIPAVLLYN